MQIVLALLLVAISPALTCNIQWPNNTDVNFVWWQCSSGPMQFYNVTPMDENGNYEYPIHLGRSLIIEMNIQNPSHVYSDPNLLVNVNLWSWGSAFGGCSWLLVPTFGLLNNLNACEHGIPCPIELGSQWMRVEIDFKKYQRVIDLLKDNAPYQIEMALHDKKTNDNACLTLQARSYIH